MLCKLDNLFTVHPENGEINKLNACEFEVINKLKKFHRNGIEFRKETGGAVKAPPLLCYRGIKKEQLQADFSKKGDESIGTLLSRLFYFGNKARHYRASNEIIQKNDYLKGINDTSKKTCNKVFDKIKNLRKSKNPVVRDFVELHHLFFSFFDDPTNKNVFYEGISLYGDTIRDYYLQLLHTVGNFGISGDITIFVSTSKYYRIAEQFATHSSGGSYIIVSVVRPSGVAQLIHAPIYKNLPILPKAALFPHQKELSIRVAIFPHNIIYVIELSNKRLIFNPRLFACENRGINPFETPLMIEQGDFLNGISTQTNLNRSLYTYDFLQLFQD